MQYARTPYNLLKVDCPIFCFYQKRGFLKDL